MQRPCSVGAALACLRRNRKPGWLEQTQGGSKVRGDGELQARIFGHWEAFLCIRWGPTAAEGQLTHTQQGPHNCAEDSRADTTSMGNSDMAQS